MNPLIFKSSASPSGGFQGFHWFFGFFGRGRERRHLHLDQPNGHHFKKTTCCNPQTKLDFNGLQLLRSINGDLDLRFRWGTSSSNLNAD
jgi:hypothetical protein